MSNTKRNRESPISPTTPEIFKKGNMQRTPNSKFMADPTPAVQDTATDMMNKMESLLSEQNKKIYQMISTEMRATEDRIKEAFSCKLGELETHVTELLIANKELKEENSCLNSRLQMVERRMIDTERERKRLNIVATGLQFETQQQGFEALQKTVDLITDKAVSVRGLRTFNTQKGKIVTAACDTWEDKMLIMRSKKRLYDNKEDGTSKIFIDSDMPPEDRKAQAKVRETANELRKQGKKVQVQFLKLKVDDKTMYYNRESQALEKRNFREENENRLLERPGPSKESQRNQ
jgi:hypothetical protein